MRTIRLIVAGSRGFGTDMMSSNDFDVMTHCLDRLLKKAYTQQDQVIIVSGTARGADQLGERYARLRYLPIARYPANWDKHGRSAGYKRNLEMSITSTHLAAFWDGVSKGTSHMIDTMLDKRKPVRVFTFDGNVILTKY